MYQFTLSRSLLPVWSLEADPLLAKHINRTYLPTHLLILTHISPHHIHSTGQFDNYTAVDLGTLVIEGSPVSHHSKHETSSRIPKNLRKPNPKLFTKVSETADSTVETAVSKACLERLDGACLTTFSFPCFSNRLTFSYTQPQTYAIHNYTERCGLSDYRLIRE